jgi:hypothetical protein
MIFKRVKNVVLGILVEVAYALVIVTGGFLIGVFFAKFF